MKEINRQMSFGIRKRPFFVWTLRILWVVWLLFWLEVSLGSRQEMEYRAFCISLAVFLISLTIGVLIWLRGYLKSIKGRNKLSANRTG